MRATELLLEDHQDIERFLAILAGAMAKLRDGEDVNSEALQRIAEFMYEFADRYHHVREEQHLFPVLEGYPLLTMAGRLDCMPGEHEIGRELTKSLREASARYAGGDRSARDEILDSAGKYLQLLGHHMGIEEGILFELADRVVSDEDDAAITAGLEKAAAAHRASGESARLRAILDDLKDYAVSPPAAAS